MVIYIGHLVRASRKGNICILQMCPITLQEKAAEAIVAFSGSPKVIQTQIPSPALVNLFILAVKKALSL